MKDENLSEVPHYELRRITIEGEEGEPEILPLSEIPPIDTKLGRRGLFGVGITLGAIFSAIEEASSQTVRDPKLLHAHRSPITDLVIAPGSKRAITAASNGEIKIWDLPGGKLVKLLEPFTSNPKRHDVFLSVSLDGQKLAAGAGNLVAIYSLESFKMEYKVLTGTQQVLKALGFAGDSSCIGIASNSWDTGKPFTSVWFCDLDPWRLSNSIQGAMDEVSAFSVQSHNQSLTIGYPGGLIEAYSLGNRKLISKLSVRPGQAAPSARLVDISSSYERNLGAFAFSDGTASQFGLNPGKRLEDLKNIGIEVTAAAVIPWSGQIAVGSKSGRLTMFEGLSGFEPNHLSGHSAAISKVAATEDGKMLISADAHGVAILWDARTGTKLGHLFDQNANLTSVEGLEFSSQNPYSSGTTSFTLPCGSPLPPGAYCTCNCVPGTFRINLPTVRPTSIPSPPISSGGGMTCLCNKICTCIPICQALKLDHFDNRVRAMADHLVSSMIGCRSEYIEWISSIAPTVIKNRIHHLKKQVTPAVFSKNDCLEYLYCCDKVVATMSAQILVEKFGTNTYGTEIDRRIGDLIRDSQKFPWYWRLGL